MTRRYAPAMPFDVTGFYYGEAMAGPLCPGCHAAKGYAADDPDAVPIFRDSEGDHPTHCEGCGGLIPHELTPDGIEYVRDAVESGDGDPATLAAWREAFLP